RFGRRKIGRREAVAGAVLDAVAALGGGDEERRMRPLIGLRHDADARDTALVIDFTMRTGGLGRMRGEIILDAAGRERRLVGRSVEDNRLLRPSSNKLADALLEHVTVFLIVGATIGDGGDGAGP